MSEPDHHRRLERIRRLTRLLDDAIRIPGTKLRFGLDAVLGLIPGAGDVVPALISAYLIRESAKMGAPRHLQVRMAGNVALDFLIGLVPLVGDWFDLTFKSNRRNLDLLARHLERRPQSAPAEPPAPPSKS